jgi:hypothetical protein
MNRLDSQGVDDGRIDEGVVAVRIDEGVVAVRIDEGVVDVDDVEDVEEWVFVLNQEQNHAIEPQNIPLVVIFLPNFQQLLEGLRILGNLAVGVKMLLPEAIPLEVGGCEVSLPPNSFAIKLDRHQDFRSLIPELSKIMAFPVIVPKRFWTRVITNSDVRMWAFIHSINMVYPHFSEWHLLFLPYSEAGLRLPNSLDLVVRERVSRTFGIALLSFAKSLAELLRQSE